MSVPIQIPVNTHTGNGLTTNWAYQFYLLDELDVVISVEGRGPQVLGVDYTVSNVGVVAGGTINFAVAPELGKQIVIRRSIRLLRDTNYQYQGDFETPVVNADFDRTWMALQDAAYNAGLVLSVPVGDLAPSREIPPASVRANKFLAFDAEGSPMVAVGTTELPVTDFIATLIDDPDAEEARATLEALGIAGGNLSGAINEVRATVASHATTADIWGAAGNAIFFSGNATVTNFPAAPQAGARRRLHCAAGITFTNNANITVQGGTNYTTASDDIVELEAVTTITFKATIFKKDGTAVVAPAPTKQMQSISAAQASGAITATFNGGSLDFRSATQTTGMPTTLNVASNNIVIPSGATLGVPSGQTARLMLLEFYNGGTPVAGIANLSGGVQLDENNLLSPTTISAGATSATTVYSASAVSANSPYRVVGYFDAVNTAGVWSSPTNVQGIGGQAGAAMASLGYGQTWQNVTASRATSTAYYNTTGKPIQVQISTVSSGAGITPTINGVALAQMIGSWQAIIPPNASYSIALSGSSINGWNELR